MAHIRNLESYGGGTAPGKMTDLIVSSDETTETAYKIERYRQHERAKSWGPRSVFLATGFQDWYYPNNEAIVGNIVMTSSGQLTVPALDADYDMWLCHISLVWSVSGGTWPANTTVTAMLDRVGFPERTVGEASFFTSTAVRTGRYVTVFSAILGQADHFSGAPPATETYQLKVWTDDTSGLIQPGTDSANIMGNTMHLRRL